MKKKLMLGLIAIVAVFGLTGCGEKTQSLDCTKKTEEQYFSANEHEVFKFKGNMLTSYDASVDFIINDEILEVMPLDDFMAKMEENYKKLGEYEGVSVVTKKTGDNKFVVTAEVKDVSKISDDASDQLNLPKTAIDIEKTTQAKKDDGYTCELK